MLSATSASCCTSCCTICCELAPHPSISDELKQPKAEPRHSYEVNQSRTDGWRIMTELHRLQPSRHVCQEGHNQSTCESCSDHVNIVDLWKKSPYNRNTLQGGMPGIRTWQVQRYHNPSRAGRAILDSPEQRATERTNTPDPSSTSRAHHPPSPRYQHPPFYTSVTTQAKASPWRQKPVFLFVAFYCCAMDNLSRRQHPLRCPGRNFRIVMQIIMTP